MTQSLQSVDILVAHESVTLRRLLASTLSDAGYVVAEAGHLEAGFDALYASKPQLAIINARMPNRTALKLAGVRIARELQALSGERHPRGVQPARRADPADRPAKQEPV